MPPMVENTSFKYALITSSVVCFYRYHENIIGQHANQCILISILHLTVRALQIHTYEGHRKL